MAKGDDSFVKLLEKWAKIDLLILGDWGLSPLSSEVCRDLLEIREDRYQRASTLITSQLPFDHWYKTKKSPTLAETILDRLFYNAFRITLKGESKRKTTALPSTPQPAGFEKGMWKMATYGKPWIPASRDPPLPTSPEKALLFFWKNTTANDPKRPAGQRRNTMKT